MFIKLYPTKEGVNLSDKDIRNKLIEECLELTFAIKTNSNISEEVFDVMQMCVNIIEKYNIDIEKSFNEHSIKLLGRNHEFIIGGGEHGKVV